jgi:hypothetical protein
MECGGSATAFTDSTLTTNSGTRNSLFSAQSQRPLRLCVIIFFLLRPPLPATQPSTLLPAITACPKLIPPSPAGTSV